MTTNDATTTRKYIVKSTTGIGGRTDYRVNYFTRAVWAVNESDARRQELLRLIEIPGSRRQTILSVELDPHAK